MSDKPSRMRLDRWLWAARFFKTRALAVEAINGGHVQLNGARTKPGKEIGIGSRLEIRRKSLRWDIEVLVLPRQRRPASEAVTFYRETDDSIARRERELEAQRLARAAAPLRTERKPDKRDRRLIHRFKQDRSGD